MSSRRKRSRGVTMVEFTLVAPVLLFVVFGIVDFGRAIQASSTVADAARQAARQATPDADVADAPFGAYTAGQACTGTSQTYQLSGTPTGCLTDPALIQTVKSVLSPVTGNVIGAPSNNCNVAPPLAGEAYVCIQPKDICTVTCAPTTTCTPGVLPTPSGNPLGDRKTEWTSHTFKGCYLVSVTVVYRYQALTPPISTIMGQGIVMSSTTSIVAEY